MRSLIDGFQLKKEERSSELIDNMTTNLVAAQLSRKNFTQIGRKGDLLCFLTEIKVEGAANAEPAMVLAHRNNPRERHTFILLSQMWAFAEPKAMTTIAPQLAEKLYGYVTKQDCFRIIDAFYDFAEDLKNAPPPSWLNNQERVSALMRDGWMTRRDGVALDG